MKKIPIYLRIVSIALLIPIMSVLICAGVSDRTSNQSSLIRQIQKRDSFNYLSAYIVENYEYSNYYNANAFYKIQQVSSYWNYESEQTNSIFFRYREKNGINIFSLIDGNDDDIPSTFLVPLSKNPISRFNFKLLVGSDKKSTNNKAFEMIYISESVADKLANSYGYSGEDKKENYSKLLERKDIRCRYNEIVSKDSYNCETAETIIAGVIDSNSLGAVGDFCESDYVFSSWSADLQLKIRCPELISLFFKDRIKNEMYLRQFKFLESANSKWRYAFSDVNGEFVEGKIDSEIKSISNKTNVFAIIMIFVFLPCLPYLFFTLREESLFLKRIVFCGGIISLIITLVIINNSLLSINITLNMWNAFLLLFEAGTMFIMFKYRQNPNYLEINI